LIEPWFEVYTTLAPFPVTAAEVLGNLLIALFCGLGLAVIYRITYRGPSYSISYVHSLVILTVIAALVIVVIGNNLARAFGLVGAMSIIRFRTAVRDTMDMVFIFLSLAIGMACGVGLQLVALIGTGMAGLLILALTFTHFGQPRSRFHLLQVAYHGENLSENTINKILSRYCRQARLVSVKNTGADYHMESTWQVLLKKNDHANGLVRDLGELEAVIFANVYFDEDDINPPTM
jgi:uncharacterized membrane protein YhiD involved in acid resistance